MKDNASSACKESFADGVETVHILNGTARLDLFTLQPDKDGKPVPVISQRLVIPLQGFMQLNKTLENAVARLAEAGVLKQEEAGKS